LTLDDARRIKLTWTYSGRSPPSHIRPHRTRASPQSLMGERVPSSNERRVLQINREYSGLGHFDLVVIFGGGVALKYDFGFNFVV